MKLQVYTVMDKAVNAFLQPFFCRAKGEAIRSFTDAVNDPKNNFSRHSSDYTLVHLGEFDDASGIFTCHDPVRVVSANECRVEDDPFTAENAASDAKIRRLPM